jgi:DNA-binding Xre family transcriptional regulator
MARRNINVAKLIRMTGLNRRTITRILDEEQDADVKLSTLEAISRALGCTLEIAIEDSKKTTSQTE